MPQITPRLGERPGAEQLFLALVPMGQIAVRPRLKHHVPVVWHRTQPLGPLVIPARLSFPRKRESSRHSPVSTSVSDRSFHPGLTDSIN